VAVFKDAEGREWLVNLDGPNIIAIRKECGINPISGDAYEELYSDPIRLGEVLAVICREQISKHASGITSDQFKAGIRGDAIDRARQAFHEAQLDFSPSREREVLRALAAKMDKLREEATAKDLQRLNSPEREKRIMDAIQKRQDAAFEEALTRLSSATSTPELSAFAPTDLPSES
jgi:hypothetical protein